MFGPFFLFTGGMLNGSGTDIYIYTYIYIHTHTVIMKHPLVFVKCFHIH